MQDLLRKPAGKHGLVHDITPQDAGWTYVGFALHSLK
ncbi:MAG: 5-deoxy-glucuronate isomerase, partial [Octadecabacter sp.]|nr:5-deoxy-glucuronate isomerase [Octadecabacter sp.]